MSNKAVESILLPLQNFLDVPTKEFRDENLDDKIHAVAFSNAVLRAAGVEKKNYDKVRKYAKNWLNKHSPDLAKYNTPQTHAQFIYVFRSFGSVGTFFRQLKKAGYMKGGRETHRGHVTAAVREYGEQSLSEVYVDDPNLHPDTQAAAAKLKRLIQRRLNKVQQPKVRYNFARRIKKTDVLADLDFVFIIPEAKESNLGDRQTIESTTKRDVERIIKKWLKENAEKIMDLEGSKSINQAYDEILTNTILGTGTTTYNKVTAGKLKSKKKATKKPTVTGGIPKMRTAKGQFTSPIALMNLINARLHNVIRQNMGSPALNYRTGRFARSVRVTNISQTRQRQMTAFYTYMKSPYQTFERGYAMGDDPRRDPRKLISKSIREAATAVMGARFDIRTRRQ